MHTRNNCKHDCQVGRHIELVFGAFGVVRCGPVCSIWFPGPISVDGRLSTALTWSPEIHPICTWIIRVFLLFRLCLGLNHNCCGTAPLCMFRWVVARLPWITIRIRSECLWNNNHANSNLNSTERFSCADHLALNVENDEITQLICSGQWWW